MASPALPARRPPHIVDVLIAERAPRQRDRRLVTEMRDLRRGESIEIEATGGLTLEVAADYGATGIDWMGVGGLTHSSPIVDLALDLV